MYNKKAFSLAEMMMAMIIIMIASVAALPAITQKKPQIPVTTIRGQFACWYNQSDNRVYQWKFNERSATTEAPVVRTNGTCQLDLDSRPAHFYIVAAGKDTTNGYDGEVITKYTPALADTLQVIIPSENDGLVQVKLPGSSSAEIAAGSGFDFLSNGLKHSNIDLGSCKIKTGQKKCPNKTSVTQKTCEIIPVYDDVSNSEIKVVRVSGCENKDLYGNPTEHNIIPLRCFKYSGLSCNQHDFSNAAFTKDSVKDFSFHKATDSVEYASDNSIAGCEAVIDGVKVNFKLNNSSNVKSQNIMGCENSEITKHKFSQILENIPNSRYSELINTLQTSYINQNGQGKGAVLILW